MIRNLDLTALRSFVTVAEVGGVTKAAGLLNLTQSAVSMQLKRLEESLDILLLDRSNRSVALTTTGEQLLSYARRMLAINDEAMSRLTAQEYEGEIIFGVPHDIVYPAIPQILQRFNAQFPRVKVQLLSSFTRKLKEQFSRGEVDIILTTEENVDAGGQTLITLPLVWVGAPDGQAWRQHPLRLAFEQTCIFRSGVQRLLDQADIPWEMAVESDSYRTIGAMVSADLAVHTMLDGTSINHLERIQHGGALPDLTSMNVNMYKKSVEKSALVDALSDLTANIFQTL
ncbi:LysR family transcriptional regulator [Parasulfitobacter algicola]|uniref:LysR family transcriptional regulator n=1 Tax=Parasulfitobacter algicola TaxID=2614809 RepID=A0ABX2IUE5_9RHOB|nr:LysR family transcriptional regulator [Sulfitobacter algicola]NSX56509.1 LysR family transcriptional regulator [Sulfitobacter algicola]